MTHETLEIDLSTTQWTDITDGALCGLITNNSEHSVRYRFSATQPLSNDTFGHILHPQQERYFNITSPLRVWALGFQQRARIALTKNFESPILTKSITSFSSDATTDASGRLRTAEPYSIFDNKNISTRNPNQWHEVVSGAILGYTGKVGTGFDIGEKIRGTLPTGKIAIGTITADNGTAVTIDCDHNDFVVGDTITQQGGVGAGTTATLTSTNTGSDIQHDYDRATVKITAGTNAGDFAYRESVLKNAYVSGKGQNPTMTFISPGHKANVLTRIGPFCDTDGPFLEIAENDVAIVIRTSTSGTPDDSRRIPQSQWNVDRFDGGASGGPNPSGETLDVTKIQYIGIPFLWQGAGPLQFVFMINNREHVVHEIETANIADAVYFRNPSLPIRYEVRNVGPTASPTTLEEICSTSASEGGYSLPGLEFSTPIVWANTRIISARTPVIAIRLKSQFPAGKNNTRMVKYHDVGAFVRTNDTLFEVAHVHDPVDIVATWNSISEDSGVEYSTDISSFIGRPEHIIDHDIQEAGGGTGKGSSTIITGEFINIHSFLGQNYDSTNSQMFVIYGTPRTGSADVLAHITWIEFD